MSIIFRIPPKCGKRRGPKPGHKTAYQKRDEVLFRMGFASYRDYLRSPLWRAIRDAKLAVDPKCEICGASKSQQVHHIAYSFKVMKGNNQRALVSTCQECHCKIEFCQDGTKRNFEGTRKKTKELLKLRNGWEKHTRRAE